MLVRLGARVGHLLFRCRDVLVPIAVVLLLVTTRRNDFLMPAAIDDWFALAGATALFVGLAIRFWVLATTGVRRSGVHRRVIAWFLYEHGPYAWCRNPLYFANSVMLIGLAAIFDSRWMALVALPAALVALASLVIAEERVLAETFGDRYQQYCARVPRLVPRGLPARGEQRPDWRRALRKEHSTIFAATSTALLLLAAEQRARFGSFGTLRGSVLVAAWLVLADAWVVVRWLKRTGRLKDAERDCSAAIGTDVAA